MHDNKEMEPMFSFYPGDVQSNGNLSEQAVVRECHGFDPSLTPKLMSELKYLGHANKPISIRIGDRDVFHVQFFNQDKQE